MKKLLWNSKMWTGLGAIFVDILVAITEEMGFRGMLMGAQLRMCRTVRLPPLHRRFTAAPPDLPLGRSLVVARLNLPRQIR